MNKVYENVALYHEWIRRKAMLMCRDRHQAEDLASETIIKCLLNSHRFDSKKDFKPWVLVIMANTYLKWIRHSKCIVMTELPQTDIPGNKDTDELISFHYLVRAIMDLNRRTPFIESVVLYAKGYNYNEISRLLRIPIGTVKSRINKGRALLRNVLRD